VRALAASTNLGNLRHLNLWGYHSTDDSEPVKQSVSGPFQGK
jgi:hypothetical protein